ncbi:hypothetical protein R3W88_033870 [Solanum pinnatisectum]|uniref:Uncharacterized protein n=1 Tax=Solanum pinnatisectum TaxID=50273 RepID=A0AAV9JZR8_9SOLN|nr:hypothetical protein R3W88_033870 [Solanum pinnatisectum]
MEDLLILFHKKIIMHMYEANMFVGDVYKLNYEVSAKIDAYDTQQFRNNMCQEEKLLINQLEDLKVEGQLLDHTFIDVVTVEKSTLDMCKHEGVKINTIYKLGRIGPHSNHFSTLCLGDEILIEPSEPIEECMEEEQCVYILEFIVPTSENYIPHLGSKK